MKVFQKNWVRLLLLLAFCGALIASVYLDAATLWAKEYRLEEQKKTEYRESLVFKSTPVWGDVSAIENMCRTAEAQKSLGNKTIRISGYDFTGEGGSLVQTEKTEETWEEFLKSQGTDSMEVLGRAGEEPKQGAVCSRMDIDKKTGFIHISGSDFVKFLDACPYEWLYSKEDRTEFRRETMEPEEDAEVYYEYDGEIFDEEEEAYRAYTEGRLNALLNECMDFDWSGSDTFTKNIEFLRLYEWENNFLLYDEKSGVLLGNRVQKTYLADIEKENDIYFSLQTVPEDIGKTDWSEAVTNGFTASLVQQLRYELNQLEPLYNYINAIEIYKDGESFIKLGEKEEEDIHISLTDKEELAYIFGKDSDVYKNEYTIQLYYDEEYFNTPMEKMSEFLYSDYMKHGDRTGQAMGVTLAAVILLVLLLISIVPSIWKREEEKLRDRVLIEVNILFTISVITVFSLVNGGIIAFFGEVFLRYFSIGGILLAGAIITVLFGLLEIAALYQLVSTIVYRIRKRCFFRGWLAGRAICWLHSKIKRVSRNMDILKRRVFYLVIIGAASFIGMVILCACAAVSAGFVGVFGMFCYFVCLIGFSYVFLKDAVDNKRLLDGCNQMKDGMFDRKIDTANLYFDKLELAEAINTMGGGLEKAVSTSMKDERMKAELITNVSHDIKTPLTSIINYVDLLKREGITPEEQQQYLKVLDTKSQRLKQLIEDLIEVSKTNTGNIELQLANLDFKELLNQAIGEFEEKFAERSLELIVTCAEHKVQIWADGRRCYRILENLFSNVYKYAMPNTRVYVDLQQEANQMVFTLKNISEAPLNVAVEELMERFVRGDVSRSTSGSGLGLSIAQNLVNLQQGKLEIKLDGDLFKVEIRFPIVQPKQDEN